MSPSLDPNRAQFLIIGMIDDWDPATRRLEIGRFTCWVAPEVRVSGVRTGVRATAVGYRDEDRDGRRIVTRLTLDGRPTTGA